MTYDTTAASMTTGIEAKGSQAAQQGKRLSRSRCSFCDNSGQALFADASAHNHGRRATSENHECVTYHCTLVLQFDDTKTQRATPMPSSATQFKRMCTYPLGRRTFGMAPSMPKPIISYDTNVCRARRMRTQMLIPLKHARHLTSSMFSPFCSAEKRRTDLHEHLVDLDPR